MAWILPLQKQRALTCIVVMETKAVDVRAPEPAEIEHTDTIELDSDGIVLLRWEGRWSVEVAVELMRQRNDHTGVYEENA